MIVLGIDPGFQVTGYGILKKEGTRAYLLDYGFLKMSSKNSLESRIGVFHTYFNDKIQKQGVTTIALETPFLGKNAQNFLKLGYLRGILYLLSDQHKLNLKEFSPRQVKLSLTGFGGAQKEQVASVVLRLFPGIPPQAKLDVTDALAVTLCGLWSSQNALSKY